MDCALIKSLHHECEIEICSVQEIYSTQHYILQYQFKCRSTKWSSGLNQPNQYSCFWSPFYAQQINYSYMKYNPYEQQTITSGFKVPYATTERRKKKEEEGVQSVICHNRRGEKSSALQVHILLAHSSVRPNAMPREQCERGFGGAGCLECARDTSTKTRADALPAQVAAVFPFLFYHCTGNRG